MDRLQKIIAAAGVCSRRKAEELMTAGRVAVNGKIVTELGTKADPVHDAIKVDGKLLPLQRSPRKTYLLLHKPKGYVTTVTDPEGRPTVMDLLRAGKNSVTERVYPVGRLDWATEGLLLMTNDGELANQLTRAASHVPKTYLVKVSGKPQESDLAKLRSGVSISTRIEGKRVKTAPAMIQLAHNAPNPWYEVTIIEGRNRQLHRMFERIGHRMEKIKRVRYGPLELDVEAGRFRPLTAGEVEGLRRAVRQPSKAGYKTARL
jgi:23S rRNA pseudouridine2605 synthase